MNCPVCKDIKLAISDKNGIEIDYCPECRGIWLDRGELDKIIERSSHINISQNPARNNREYNDDYQKHGYKKKKKGGFLEDLFDF